MPTVADWEGGRWKEVEVFVSGRAWSQVLKTLPVARRGDVSGFQEKARIAEVDGSEDEAA